MEAPNNLEACKLRIREVIEKNSQEIIEEFYQKWCIHISEVDEKGRDINWLKKKCTPVKKRFSSVLDTFMVMLVNGDRDYSTCANDRELLEYALRFVIPAKHRDLNSHVVVKIVKSFFETVYQVVLRNIRWSDYSVAETEILNVMNELGYMCFENLWVTSVVGFKYQHRTIQELLSKLMKAQEEERQKFWTEIHDEFLQTLAVIPVRLQVIEELSESDVRAMKKELNQLRLMVEETAQAMREASHGFNLFWTERKGLAFSLRAFVRRFEKEFKMPVALSICKKGESIRGFSGVTLFRIIQEGLYNAGKHSKATCAAVRISDSDGDIVTEIQDNGVGFDVRKSLRKSLGLKNLGLTFIKERVRLLNASLDIQSAKNAGTRLVVRIPSSTFSAAPLSVRAAGSRYYES